jgi:tetratricopeptide (TPR) repeat protein
LPAYRALSKGIVALENGDKNEAIEWFEFALVENPDSVESSLFLAETLFQQNRPKESSDRLQHVLQKGSLSAYNKATATNILSRISEQQGQLDDALRYAQNSLSTDTTGQCSVDFVEQRIERLQSGLAMSPTPSNHNDSQLKQARPLSESYIEQCQQLNKREAQSSSCQASENQAMAFSRNAISALEEIA